MGSALLVAISLIACQASPKTSNADVSKIIVKGLEERWAYMDKRDDNSIKDFYIKKKQQSNPMCSKAAKTACASKLVRIIYSMCRTGELYQYNK